MEGRQEEKFEPTSWGLKKKNIKELEVEVEVEVLYYSLKLS